MKSLTVQQPWPAAIAHLGKTVENRSWDTRHRGDLAIHAGADVGTTWPFEDSVETVAALSGLEPEGVRRLAAPRGAVVAVVSLIGVCSDSLYSERLVCTCGPWAFPRYRHFLLGDVRLLSEPVSVRGAQRLWTLPDGVEAAVLAQVGQVAR